MSSTVRASSIFLLAFLAGSPKAFSQETKRGDDNIYSRKNLVAWCIVPFDGKKRGPAARAAMIKKLGLSRIAYDWRDKDVATFEQEILEYKKHGLEYFAFWSSHEEAFRLFEKYDLHPQIWKMLAEAKAPTQLARVMAAAKQILPLVERTRKMGCRLGLYNHGGWAGEPENMVAVCRYLRKHHKADHVGIVYNLHHGHAHVAGFRQKLTLMKPYLLCLNLNGMTTNGDRNGRKILPLGEGEHDVTLLKTIRSSGYSGPIGIIGHTQDDVEKRLQDNLDGLDWILPQLDGKPAGPKPKLRTWSPRKSVPRSSQVGGVVLPGRAAYRTPPITVECRVTLPRKDSYNILVASDSKQSGAHWEIFSMTGSGMLTSYLPGMLPDHVHSKAMICDGRPHSIGMTYESNRVRMFVDGKMVADQSVKSRSRPAVPGGLGIGRLVREKLGCSGTIQWLRISRGARTPTAAAKVERDTNTVLLWRAKPPGNDASQSRRRTTPAYSDAVVKDLADRARKRGDARRGLMAFSSARSACLSCHKLGRHGGSVGPDLSQIGRTKKPEQIVESVLWPQREVKKEFNAHAILTDDGRSHRGYIVRRNGQELVLRDPTKATQSDRTIPLAQIEAEQVVGTLMPDNLIASLTEDDLESLLRFLFSLGREDGIPPADMHALLEHAAVHMRGPASFPIDPRPLKTADWPSWKHPVNRDRLYDFYGRQADHFRQQQSKPHLVAPFPGMDGGNQGHWGNQNETTWASGLWNQTDLGTLHCGVFRGGGVTVPRGVCVRLGNGKISTCFNPDTLTYDAVWTGGFVKFSSVRHGFMHGAMMDGTPQQRPAGRRPDRPFVYHGFYRAGRQVIFAYRIGKQEFLNAPRLRNGKFEPLVAPADKHPLRHLLQGAAAQWPQRIRTAIRPGKGSPYAVDTIELPTKNPWNSLLYCGGHGFLKDGSALVCTMQGDVWHVSGFQHPSRQAVWRRFAAGLHQPQGLVVDEDGIFVLGRDQITRLHDNNGDGEADFYECFSNAYVTSPAGHDFICGLERDQEGRFYTSSGNQGLVRISADGKSARVIATGFRNPDGLGLFGDGTVTVPCSEGEWTPATMICAVKPQSGPGIPHFGYRGPKNGRPPELPIAYLPRGLDNSAGGQTLVKSDKWGPLKGQLLHFSFGTGSHFLLLRDEVGGQLQGAIVPLPGEFRSGAHRGRFNPVDGQLYVSGMQGWGSYTVNRGSFERVRYTGSRVQLPVGFHVHRNGVQITFSAPLPESVSEASSHFAQCWNYRYSAAYGSPEFSARHPGMQGHDVIRIKAAHRVSDRSIFLELPELQPVNQLHLRVQSSPGQFHDLFVTVHKLDKPFDRFTGYEPSNKVVRPHPILADLALAERRIPNPFRAKIADARKVLIETGTNLSYATRTVRVKRGRPIELTLSNPDVVPHNWALVKPGTLRRVGRLSNRLISDPDAVVRHYIPQSSDVLAYTNVVLPRDKFTIYFKAPTVPGRYPFLCTFPGHWLVMNGEMIVE